MAKSTKDIIDDDGNIIAPPPPESPVAQAVWLLEYARLRGFAIPKVQIGDVTILVTDLRQVKAMGAENGRPNDLEPGSDMDLVLNQHGDA